MAAFWRRSGPTCRPCEVIMFTEWEDLVASGEPSTPLPDVHPDDTAQIQYTSGDGNEGAELHHRV
jgi:fatty-acyl-CoA synthase